MAHPKWPRVPIRGNPALEIVRTRQGRVPSDRKLRALVHAYPPKLVTSEGHLFVRWEDGKERLNIEAFSRGVNRFSDEFV